MEIATTTEAVRRGGFWLHLAILAMVALILLPQAWHRPIDRDEGFWINSARLVTHNMLPYQDFPLPHAPLMPYFYGFWCNLMGWSLPSARLLSILLAITLLIIVEMTAGARHQPSSLIAMLLLGLSSAFINWQVPIKIYAGFNLFVFVSWAGFEWARRARNPLPMVISGVAMGLAFAVRITALALIVLPLVFIWQLRSQTGGNWQVRLSGAGLYILGLIVGFLPAFNLYLFTWPGGLQQAWFLHEGILGEKSILGRFYAPYELAVQTPDAAILMVVAIIAGITHLLRRGEARSATWAPLAFLLAISVIAIAPGSAVGQYFSTAIPFAAVLVAPFVYELIIGAKEWRRTMWQFSLAALMIVGVFRFPWRVFNDYQDKPLTGTMQVAATEHALNALVPAGTEVLAFWPGYNGLADRPCIPGTELGKFTMRLGGSLAPDEWGTYRLLPDSVWQGMLARGEIAAVVAGIDSPLDQTDPRTMQDNREFYQQQKAFLDLLRLHYEDQGIFGGAHIYLRRREPVAQ